MSDSTQGPSSARKVKKALPVGHYRGLGTWTVVFFIFLYLPIVVLIFYSFNANRMVMNWGGFGIDWYIKAFQNDDIQKAVWNSLIVATVATVFATAIATIGALVLARGGNFRGKTVSLGLITLPLMVHHRPHHLLYSLCLHADSRQAGRYGHVAGASRA
jgi:ABC-type spermidine/putrescine transport system permease subunit II